jgi:hypothetical protein
MVRAHGDFSVVPDLDRDRGFERMLATSGDDYKWRPAGLLWPPEQDAIPRYDIAILEVQPQDALEHIANAPTVVCREPPDEDVSCRATGFAEWTRDRTKSGSHVADPCTVTGFLTTGTARYSTCRTFTVTNASPIEAKAWSGLSGAAFFDNKTRSLVGLASEIRPASMNNALWVTRLADLANHADLEGFWTAAGLSLSREAPMEMVPWCPHSPRHDPSEHLHQFDRKPQVDSVFDALQPPDQPADDPDPEDPQLPVVFLISGRIQDLPYEMVKRLRGELGNEWLGEHRSKKARALEWRKNEPPESTVRGLQRDIIEYLTNGRRLVPLSTLSQDAMGKDWTLEIDVSQADSRDVASLAQFLALFATFGETKSPPALYVTLFPGSSNMLARDNGHMQRFLVDLAQQSALFASRVILVKDIFLNDCDYTHIRPWVDIFDNECVEAAKRCFDYLDEVFRNARPFPLHRIKDLLSVAQAR